MPSEERMEKLLAQGKNASEILRIKSWKCINFFRDKLDLMVEYENPLQISIAEVKDWILIQFIDSLMFTNSKETMRLMKNSTRLVFPLPK